MTPFTALAATLLVACSFSPGRLAGGDAAVIDPDAPDALVIVPDASQCVAADAQCIGDTLRKCSGPGAMAVDRVCNWGCNSVSSTDAACYELAPAGGWEMQGTGDTTDFQGLGAVTIPAAATIDTDAGTITGVNASLFDFQTRTIDSTMDAGVFRFRSLTLGSVSAVGAKALVLVADEGITLTGILDAVPACAYADVSTPGPGGYPGGDGPNVVGEPAPPDGGGGAGGTGNDGGGGGGGHGAMGGDGGNIAQSGGNTRGDAAISSLLGGSGGGGGDDHSNAGRGGGGGAAIHLIANGPIVLMSGSGINAGGCGGRAGTNTNDGGGGGGAGGAVLLEGTTVTIAGTIAVNGGGGGGGNTGAMTVGQKGQLSRSRAAGGLPGAGSSGGDGGAGDTPAGIVGTNASGGGGGGGIGRIRVNTRSGTVSRTNAVLSPGPGDTNTTYSEAAAQRR